MDEKKVRKAVQMLRIEKKECKKLLDFHGNKQWNSGILRRKIEALDIAIEALEKQLPKKPIDKSCVKDNDTIYGYVGICPSCNGIVDDSMIVCDCTQVLDWSE